VEARQLSARALQADARAHQADSEQRTCVEMLQREQAERLAEVAKVRIITQHHPSQSPPIVSIELIHDHSNLSCWSRFVCLSCS
jgi:hypothetical protein